MKKFFLVLLLIFGLFLVGPFAYEVHSIDVDYYAGGFYTSFSDEALDDYHGDDFDELSNIIDVSSGFGFNAGAEIGVIPEFSAIAEFEHIRSSDDFSDSGTITYEDHDYNWDLDYEHNISISALKAKGAINLSEIIEVDTVGLQLIGGAGYYFGEWSKEGEGNYDHEQGDYEETRTLIDENLDIGEIGFTVGSKIEFDFTESLSVFGDIEYRLLDIENYNFNGIKGMGGLSFGF